MERRIRGKLIEREEKMTRDAGDGNGIWMISAPLEARFASSSRD